MQRQGSKNIKLSQTRPPFHTVAYKTLSCQDAPNAAAFETRGCPHKTQPRNLVERNSIIKHQPSLHIFLSLRIEIYTFFKKSLLQEEKNNTSPADTKRQCPPNLLESGGRTPSTVRVVQRRASAYRGVRPLVLSKLCRRVCSGQAARHVHGRVEVLCPALPNLPHVEKAKGSVGRRT